MSHCRQDDSFPYLEIEQGYTFPDIPDGKESLVAIGGNLSPGMLLSAYLQGIFPWFDEHDPLYWWSPNPRFVIFAQDFHQPRRLKRFIKNTPYTYTCDTAFEQVIVACAKTKRGKDDGTWIQADVIEAYCEFHRLGFAHSVETWYENQLVGGFYGVALGDIFFGESMFTVQKEAAKSAFCLFARQFFASGGKLIDSQIYTDHIARFGARNISREAFLTLEKEYLCNPLQFPYTFPAVLCP
ncbi:MAG: leucyl/phenylalanyl-tRNA--protein transferase [Treponemataceae bacterium]